MQIKVAICEDDVREQRAIAALLHKWAENCHYHLTIDIFEDSLKLEGKIDAAFDTYDVYLLDINMSQPQEGLELAQRIRKHSLHTPIIFVTSHKELMYDAFDVQALHFIVKPIQEKRLFSALDRLSWLLKQRKDSFFTCKIAGELRRFPIQDIYFFTTKGHYLLINGDNALYTRLKLGEVIENYADHFMMCNQGCAINTSHIRSIRFGALRVTLNNGVELPAGKGYLVNLRKRFSELFSIE